MTGLEDYSGFEVIRTAMEVEKSGHLFYKAVAAKARSPLAREIFTWLAQDEVGHLKTLEGLVSRYQQGAFWEEEDFVLPYLRRFADKELFPPADRLAELLDAENFDARALDLAIAAEDRFSDYFRGAAKHARNEEGREAFTWLAEEEARHARILQERKAKIFGDEAQPSGPGA